MGGETFSYFFLVFQRAFASAEIELEILWQRRRSSATKEDRESLHLLTNVEDLVEDCTRQVFWLNYINFSKLGLLLQFCHLIYNLGLYSPKMLPILQFPRSLGRLPGADRSILPLLACLRRPEIIQDLQVRVLIGAEIEFSAGTLYFLQRLNNPGVNVFLIIFCRYEL